MKKLFLIPLFMLVMASCSAAVLPAPPVVDLTQVHNDTVITCQSNLEHYTLEYLKSQRTDEKSKIFADFTISNVIDVEGKHWVINQTEWQDYTCVSKFLP